MCLSYTVKERKQVKFMARRIPRRIRRQLLTGKKAQAAREARSKAKLSRVKQHSATYHRAVEALVEQDRLAALTQQRQNLQHQHVGYLKNQADQDWTNWDDDQQIFMAHNVLDNPSLDIINQAISSTLNATYDTKETMHWTPIQCAFAYARAFPLEENASLYASVENLRLHDRPQTMYQAMLASWPTNLQSNACTKLNQLVAKHQGKPKNFTFAALRALVDHIQVARQFCDNEVDLAQINLMQAQLRAFCNRFDLATMIDAWETTPIMAKQLAEQHCLRLCRANPTDETRILSQAHYHKSLSQISQATSEDVIQQACETILRTVSPNTELSAPCINIAREDLYTVAQHCSNASFSEHRDILLCLEKFKNTPHMDVPSIETQLQRLAAHEEALAKKLDIDSVKMCAIVRIAKTSIASEKTQLWAKHQETIDRALSNIVMPSTPNLKLKALNTTIAKRTKQRMQTLAPTRIKHQWFSKHSPKKNPIKNVSSHPKDTSIADRVISLAQAHGAVNITISSGAKFNNSFNFANQALRACIRYGVEAAIKVADIHTLTADEKEWQQLLNCHQHILHAMHCQPSFDSQDRLAVMIYQLQCLKAFASNNPTTFAMKTLTCYAEMMGPDWSKKFKSSIHQAQADETVSATSSQESVRTINEYSDAPSVPGDNENSDIVVPRTTNQHFDSNDLPDIVPTQTHAAGQTPARSRNLRSTQDDTTNTTTRRHPHRYTRQRPAHETTPDADESSLSVGPANNPPSPSPAPILSVGPRGNSSSP